MMGRSLATRRGCAVGRLRSASGTATRARRAREGGFSLLEVLIALFVLSLGAASVLSLFAAAAATHKRGIDRTHAALIAERIVAEVEARYRADDDAKVLAERVRAEVPRTEGNYGWDIFLHHPAGKIGSGRRRLADSGSAEPGRGPWSPEELYVEVHVTWRQKSLPRTEVFRSIVLPSLR